MSNIVTELGDKTSHDVKPDFDSAKGYYWMKQIDAIRKNGTPVKNWPRKPAKTLAEKSFKEQVEKRLSRSSFSPGIAFDENGKRIWE